MGPLALLSAFGLGLVAGAKHAASGPDHLAAVAPFAARAGRRAGRVGAAWGLGHASGAALAAALALALRAVVPGLEQRLSAASEVLVGVLLCALGFAGLWSLAGGGPVGHAHADAAPDARAAGPRAQRAEPPTFVLGLLHGSAGIAHLFAVLPAVALPGLALPASYLAGYGAGSLAAIALFASALGWSGARVGGRRAWVALTSAASVSVGVAWIALSR